MSQFQGNSIFWIEVEKIKPNPFQPRKEFDEARLREMADSIRQYGILQPLTVTRREYEKEDGGIGVEYELIAGERRLRAARIAGLREIPATIRIGAEEEDDRMKLELAIIENLQREDLSPIDRARAFARLATEFAFTHVDIGKKVGKSREYVSNTIRLLALPQEVIDALVAGKISEGHTRPILMLSNRPEEQVVLFKEILYKKITVREAEQLARRVAYEKVRRHELMQDPALLEMEEKLTEKFGTRVRIEKKSVGGKLVIDFFSHEDLESILGAMETGATLGRTALMDRYAGKMEEVKEANVGETAQSAPFEPNSSEYPTNPLDDPMPEEIK
ncbi:ParB/RepB/Spo0J family partition protein [bacterium]|nr:ParB/RepB/Spo0J family partition protein [bacterium]